MEDVERKMRELHRDRLDTVTEDATHSIESFDSWLGPGPSDLRPAHLKEIFKSTRRGPGRILQRTVQKQIQQRQQEASHSITACRATQEQRGLTAHRHGRHPEAAVSPLRRSGICVRVSSPVAGGGSGPERRGEGGQL